MASISHWLRVFGVDLRRAVGAPGRVAGYWRDRRQFRAGLREDFRWGRELPILDERAAASGGLGAYFQQDLLVARWIHGARPVRHVDVGSRIDGFIGHLAVFRQVDVLDIRPHPGSVENERFHQVDLTEELAPEWRECTDSLSCLHTIEHFGLGRYGDALDVDGHLKGLAQLTGMVAPGGVLYLSVPLGPQRVEFNAHRVFSAATVLGWFDGGWRVERLAVIDDEDRPVENVEARPAMVAGNFGCQLGVLIVAARKTAGTAEGGKESGLRAGG